MHMRATRCDISTTSEMFVNQLATQVMWCMSVQLNTLKMHSNSLWSSLLRACVVYYIEYSFAFSFHIRISRLDIIKVLLHLYRERNKIT